MQVFLVLLGGLAGMLAVLLLAFVVLSLGGSVPDYWVNLAAFLAIPGGAAVVGFSLKARRERGGTRRGN